MEVVRSETKIVGFTRLKNRRVLAAITVLVGAAGTVLVLYKLRVHFRHYLSPEEGETLQKSLLEKIRQYGYQVKDHLIGTIGSTDVDHGTFTEMGVEAKTDGPTAEQQAATLVNAAKEALESLR